MATMLLIAVCIATVVFLYKVFKQSSRYEREGCNENTLTYDELSVIETCEEFHQSGKDIDDPEWRRHQERISSLVERGVYQEQNAYGDWVWHKDKASQKSFWAWLNNGE